LQNTNEIFDVLCTQTPERMNPEADYPGYDDLSSAGWWADLFVLYILHTNIGTYSMSYSLH